MSRNSSVALSREGTRKNGREKRMSVSSQTTLQKLVLKGKKKNLKGTKRGTGRGGG